MHRPHRSIEVFDISLMAVVTKAMGAFLVIMLLLLPYYSSGSIGDQSAAEAAQQLAQAQQQLEALKQQLSGRSPDEIAKALQDTLDRLAQAEAAIKELRRDNDALNAQAQRLDAANSELRDKLDKAETEANKIRLSGTLINSDCSNVRLEYGVMSKDEYIDLSDKGRLTYLLNHILSLGTTLVSTDDDVVAANSSQASIPRGHGMRFDHSTFQYNAPPGDFFLVVASTAKASSKIDDLNGHALQSAPAECHPILTLNYYAPKKGDFNSFWIREITLGKDDYAVMPAQLKVTEDAVTWSAPSAEALAWLHDQIDHATKANPPSGTPSQ